MSELRRLFFRRAFWQLLFCLVLVAVLLLAWLPVSDVGTGSDKLNHVLAFVVLGLLAQAAWPSWRAMALAGLLVLGGLIELVQAQVGRDASGGDWLADAVGLVMAVLLWFLSSVWRARLRRE